MVWWEAVLAYDAAVNAETDTLEVLAPTSLTTRTGHGSPLLTHAYMLTSTDDVEKAYVVPSGFPDANGIPIPYINIYGATASFDLKQSRLPVPVQIPENRLLNIYATSETAANTVCVAWLCLQYPGGGKCVPKPSFRAPVRRAWEHGAALTSVVAANSTDITTLVSGKKYWPAAVGHVGVNGGTAGCVGPAFMKFRNSEFEGAEAWFPLINNLGYSAANGDCVFDFDKLGIPMPILDGGNILQTACVGYTAEQPQGELYFLVDQP